MTLDPSLCQHCWSRKGSSRARGLCYACRGDPAIRAQYPSAVKVGHGLDEARQLPDHPTQAPAGSDEKVLALAERARLGQRLWHAQDSAGIVRPPESMRFAPRSGKHVYPSILTKEPA